MFDQLFQDMQAEDAVGVLLAAHLGNTPDEILFVIQSTRFDRSMGGLRPQHQYIIRAVGLAEHKISLGTFQDISLIDDHPLLYHHNTPRVRVFISSQPESPDTLLQDISRAHTEVYDTWRDLADDLNQLVEPPQLFAAGFGLFGEMPQPFADAVSQVFTRHGVKHNLVIDETSPRQMKLLSIDDSYCVAADFSIEAAEK